MVLPRQSPDAREPSDELEPEPLLRATTAALNGDTAALRVLLTALAPDIARVARCVLGSTAAELDDVVQESLLGLVRALPGFRAESSLRRFANRIAVRTAIGARRRQRVRRGHDERFFSHAAPLDHTAPDPENQYRSARREALLARLLDELPEAQAETLALRVVLGFSLEETARATNVPENTVRSRLRLAREALRERIEREPSLHDLLEVEP
ncbi:MAG TPA: RNA polymerase sigma factor [Polyangiales bacterium]|nr:RNA polymerase sigma factor [Polyangiales bacterium]